MQTFSRIPLKELDNITQSIELFNLKFNEKMKKYFPDYLLFSSQKSKKGAKKVVFKKMFITKEMKKKIFDNIRKFFIKNYEDIRKQCMKKTKSQYFNTSKRRVFVNILRKIYSYLKYLPSICLYTNLQKQKLFQYHKLTELSLKKKTLKFKKDKKNKNLMRSNSLVVNKLLTNSTSFFSSFGGGSKNKTNSVSFSQNAKKNSSTGSIILPKIDKVCESTLKATNSLKVELKDIQNNKEFPKKKKIKRRKKKIGLKGYKIFSLSPDGKQNKKQLLFNNSNNILVKTYNLDKINNDSSYLNRGFMMKKYSLHLEFDDNQNEGPKKSLFSLEGAKNDHIITEKKEPSKKDPLGTQKVFFGEVNRKLAILQKQKYHFEKLHFKNIKKDNK